MGKPVRLENKQEKSAVDEIDTDALIESAQGERNPPPAETRSAGSTGKEKAREAIDGAYEELPRRSGDPCPRPGCRGFLGVMSTHKFEKEGLRVRHLSCDSCKKVGGKEVTQL